MLHRQAGVGLGLSLSSSLVKIRPGQAQQLQTPRETTQLDRLYLPLPRAPGLCDFTLGRPLRHCAMRETESHSRSAMSLSGKTAASSSCLSSQCFDLLTRSCVKCSDLFKDNTSKGTKAAGTKLPGTGWLWARGAGGTPGVGGREDLLLQIVMDMVMVDRGLSSPGGRGRRREEEGN